MKISKIAQTNKKGQLVIPSDYRKELGIDSDTHLELEIFDGMLIVKPIEQVITNVDKVNDYQQILMKTKGRWLSEDKDGDNRSAFDKSSARKNELKESKKLKDQQW
jgi:AbrB family looped-hinge helix DNA binding protein